MNKKNNLHIPVLLEEAIEHLVTDPNGIYIDATFGRGSHSRHLLARLDAKARLIAFDQDPEAIEFAHATVTDKRFEIIHASYASLLQQLSERYLVGKIAGILFDLGVSSPQLDNPERGFSFSQSGPLDMRMNNSAGIDAATWLQNIDETALANIIWQYGEEKFSRRIAKAIVLARQENAITTTGQLAEIIKKATPQIKYDKHPATRTFQAIRIAINAELDDLEKGLAGALQVLAKGGRLAVISFHSLEDRIVKQFMRLHEKGEELPRGLPVKASTHQAVLKGLGKAIKPSDHEVNKNPRARSAILRLAEKQL